MQWLDFKQKVEILLRGLVDVVDNEDCINYYINNREYKFTEHEYEKMMEEFNSYNYSKYVIYDDHHYEVIIDQTNRMNRRIIPRFIFPDNDIVIDLPDHINKKIEYKLQELSDMMVLNVIRIGDTFELKRSMSSIGLRHLINENLDLMDILRLSIRNLYSVCIIYEENISVSKIFEYIDAFLFNICYNYGISFRMLNDEDDFLLNRNRFKPRINLLELT